MKRCSLGFEREGRRVIPEGRIKMERSSQGDGPLCGREFKRDGGKPAE